MSDGVESCFCFVFVFVALRSRFCIYEAFIATHTIGVRDARGEGEGVVSSLSLTGCSPTYYCTLYLRAKPIHQVGL